MHNLPGNKFRLKSPMAYILSIFFGFFCSAMQKFGGQTGNFLREMMREFGFMILRILNVFLTTVSEYGPKKNYDKKGVESR